MDAPGICFVYADICEVFVV